jgi:hypothetical protein
LGPQNQTNQAISTQTNDQYTSWQPWYLYPTTQHILGEAHRQAANEAKMVPNKAPPLQDQRILALYSHVKPEASTGIYSLKPFLSFPLDNSP